MSGKPSLDRCRAVPFLTLALLLSAFVGTAQAGRPIPDGDSAALATAIAEAGSHTVIKLAKDGNYDLSDLDPSTLKIARDQDIVIRGRGATIRGNQNIAFQVNPGGNLTLIDLEVTGSRATTGAGIHNAGTLVLKGSSSIHDNRAETVGGGIYNVGTLVLKGSSSIHDNSAGSWGGGIYNTGGTVILKQTSSIHHNEAKVDYGGGIANRGGTVTLHDRSSIHYNRAGTSGGGIFNGVDSNDNLGTVTLDGRSSIHHNTSTSRLGSNSGGGGIYTLGEGNTVTLKMRSSIHDNRADADGGGIFNGGSTVTLDGRSSIHHNTADYDHDSIGQGGGILDDGILINADDGGNVYDNDPNNIIVP